ncbi:MAG: hypothetical protein Tsb0034_02990 [Ekhidna sp.]
MKRLLLIFFILSTLTVFGQQESATGNGVRKLYIFKSSGDDIEFLSKNGHQILPKKGDWALGVDALPFLEYVGNVANGNDDNDNISFDYAERNLPTATIYGKYFIADDLAYRGSLNIFANGNRDRFRVNDDASTNPDDAVFDVRDIDNFGFTLSAGLEKRRGKSRVQGLYGAEAFIHFTTNSTYKFQYGNSITQSNQEPTSTGFGNPTGIPAPSLGYRITKADFGNRMEFGLRGFIGVEYFFAPKMSLGGEFYMLASHSSTDNSSVTYEAYEGTSNSVEEFSTFTEGNRDFNIGIRNSFGAINLMFYF